MLHSKIGFKVVVTLALVIGVVIFSLGIDHGFLALFSVFTHFICIILVIQMCLMHLQCI